MISTPVLTGVYFRSRSRKVSRVGCFRHHEDTMNCQNCNTKIDYRFLTYCIQCGCAVETTDTLQPQLLPQFQPVEPVQKRLGWTRTLLNLGYLLVSSVAGLLIGGAVIFFGGVMIFRAVMAVIHPGPIGCGLGSMIGFMMLHGAAFLGTIAGSAFAVKRPLCKAPTH